MPEKPKSGKRVMLFGVFDRLHPGHLFVLYHARLLGEELVVVVARDRSVRSLKRRRAREDERLRINNVRKTALPTKVVLGDVKQGSYTVIRRYKPNIIAVGYDQKELMADLRQKTKNGELPMTTIVRLRPYRPKKYHTSLLA